MLGFAVVSVDGSGREIGFHLSIDGSDVRVAVVYVMAMDKWVVGSAIPLFRLNLIRSGVDIRALLLAEYLMLCRLGLVEGVGEISDADERARKLEGV